MKNQAPRSKNFIRTRYMFNFAELINLIIKNANMKNNLID